jgi:DNA polymerase III delta prime subunit
MKLFPSTIIVYQNSKQVDDQLDQICQSLGHKYSPNNPDIYQINIETGWTIELIRSLKNFISQKPFNHQNKIIIISEAHNLNIESQNALLKTLEEPGEDNYLILTTNQPSKLLNTIISRCHLIKLINQDKNNLSQEKIKITGNFAKDTLAIDNIYKNKEQILSFLREQLFLFQKDLINKPDKRTNQIIQKIIKSINMIEANVDPRSALDFIFLS